MSRVDRGGRDGERRLGRGERALVGLGEHLEHRPVREHRALEHRQVDLVGVHRRVLDVDRGQLQLAEPGLERRQLEGQPGGAQRRDAGEVVGADLAVVPAAEDPAGPRQRRLGLAPAVPRLPELEHRELGLDVAVHPRPEAAGVGGQGPVGGGLGGVDPVLRPQHRGLEDQQLLVPGPDVERDRGQRVGDHVGALPPDQVDGELPQHPQLQVEVAGEPGVADRPLGVAPVDVLLGRAVVRLDDPHPVRPGGRGPAAEQVEQQRVVAPADRARRRRRGRR